MFLRDYDSPAFGRDDYCSICGNSGIDSYESGYCSCTWGQKRYKKDRDDAMEEDHYQEMQELQREQQALEDEEDDI